MTEAAEGANQESGQTEGQDQQQGTDQQQQAQGGQESGAQEQEQGQQGQGSQEGEKPFYGDLPEDLQAYIEKAGYKNWEGIAKSAMNLEKMVGHKNEDVIIRPKDETPEAMRDFFTKIGTPEEPAGYDFSSIEMPEGAEKSEATEEWFRKAAWEAGVPGAAAKDLYESWNGFVAEQLQAHQVEEKLQSEKELNDVKRELGSAFDSHAEGARRLVGKVFGELGVEGQEVQNTLGKVEDAIGTGMFVKLFGTLAAGMGEGRFVNKEGGEEGFGMTPQAAKAKKEELLSDKDYSKKYLAGDKAKFNEIKQLEEIIASGK